MARLDSLGYRCDALNCGGEIAVPAAMFNADPKILSTAARAAGWKIVAITPIGPCKEIHLCPKDHA